MGFKEFIREDINKKTVFVSLLPSEKTILKLKEFLEKNRIPVTRDYDGEKIDEMDYHVTVFYSKSNADIEPQIIHIDPFHADIDKIDYFGTEKNILVLRLKNNPELKSIYDFYYHVYGLRSDFDEYKPHLSLSYDDNVKLNKIPEFPLIFDKIMIDVREDLNEGLVSDAFSNKMIYDVMSNKNGNHISYTGKVTTKNVGELKNSLMKLGLSYQGRNNNNQDVFNDTENKGNLYIKPEGQDNYSQNRTFYRDIIGNDIISNMSNMNEEKLDFKLLGYDDSSNRIDTLINGKKYSHEVPEGIHDVYTHAKKLYVYSPGKALNYIKRNSR